PLAPSIWNALPNEGSFTINFYANDSANNINDTYSLLLYKDVIPPDVNINSPNLYSLYGVKPPSYDISINEIYLQNTWYYLDNGTLTSQNIPFAFLIDTTVSESIWDIFGNGTVTIVFYANDSAGNYDYDSVIVRKDIVQPHILINLPNSNDLFSYASPNYNVRISDINGIDNSWYSLNDGANTDFTSNGSINQILWENLDNGTITIKFYANDSVGNVGYNWVIVRKDILAPIINIDEPNPYDQFGITPPDVEVAFFDGNLHSIWYQLIGTSTTINYTWTGTIENYVWDQMGNGLVVIQFYANDSLGNFGSNSVIIRKDTTAPDVTINSPEDDQLYGHIPPEVNVDFGPDIDHKWYQLIGTTTTANHTWTGTITQDVWDEVGNGTVIVFIYANDSLGNIGYDSVWIKKDILGPIIVINEPEPYSLFGKTAPLFNLDFNEGNLNETWYQLIGTIITDNHSWTEVIDQNLWDLMDNGTITVIFYANDTIGNFGSTSIVLRKDIIAPEITFNQPEPNSLFGIPAPAVIVNFSDPNLNYAWYQLDDGTTLTINYTWTGSMSQIAWGQVGNGTILIIFYANDTLGNTNSKTLIVRKDIIEPTITVNSPNDYELFGKIRPDVNVVISDQHLEAAWYQLSNLTITTANYSWMDVIDQIVWNQIGNGTVNIIFYANDSVGNLAFRTIIVRKDIISPQITIVEPSSYDLFGITPPSVEIEIFEPNSNVIWYQLTDGTTSNNYTWFGNIDQSAWNLFGTGLVTIKFYANDSVGNFGSNSVTIRKDITAPDITITSPYPFELFGLIAPIAIINVDDPNIDNTWYVLFNSTKSTANYTWLGTIEQSVWEEFKSGIITIRFYANDTLGNTRFSDVTIMKDVTPPDISINEPNPYELFGAIPPIIIINVFDDNPDDVWYKLTDGIITTDNYTWTEEISQTIWNELGNGTIIITFYANDTMSNLAVEDITIRKDIIAPTININYPFNYSLYGNIPPDVYLNVTDPHLDEIWYQLDNGTILTGNYSWIENIAQTAWDEVGNGTVSIIFYANDSVGNLDSNILILRKEIFAPKITIHYPNPYELFGKSPPAVNVEFNDSNSFETWYQLKNGTITTLNFTWINSIDQILWDQMGNGTVTIIFYANDSLGNFAFKTIIVRKDIIAPSITIHSPNPYDVFGETPPLVIVEFNDPNLNSTWYQLRNGTIITQNYTWFGVIEQSVWDEVGNGTVTIFFYANDSMSNLGVKEMTIRKDLNAPIIDIIEPIDMEIFTTIAPNFTLYTSGVDIDKCWYIFSGNPNKYFFTKLDGITIISVNQTGWDDFGNGTVKLEFYINDSVGNIGFDSIELRKDIFAPEVTINLAVYEGYHNEPPILNISFSDPNYDTIWYKIGTNNIKLINNTEQRVDPLLWNSLDEGEFQIYIFANDTAGNINDTYSFTLFKDTIAPLIIINSPIDNSYSTDPPTLNITCFDPNFDVLWYGDGNINITLTNNTNQSFDWGIWQDLPDGIYHVFIYANDTFGHLNDQVVLNLYKDTIAPVITIHSPDNNTCYAQPPIIDIAATDPNFDSLWYKIGEFTEFLPNHIEIEIDEYIWNSLPQGKFEMHIYANDSYGYLNNYYSLTLYKDTLAPRIVINSPTNQTYWNTYPIINVTVFEPNLDVLMYEFGGVYSFLTNNTEEYLIPYIWGSLVEGNFTIQIYARDIFGHINDSCILTLFKDTIKPNITINYPLSNSLYGKKAPDFNISASKFNLHKVWYNLWLYPEDYLLIEFSGSINQEAWDQFGNGTVKIRFYANDTTGNVKMEQIIVRKDIYAPLIKISEPFNNTIWDSPPKINISVSEPNLDSIWYEIGVFNRKLINNNEQTIDSLIWDSLDQGKHQLFIYANDTVGNLNNTYEFTIYKDTLAPYITIISPIEYQEVGETAPQYNLTIIEDNLNTRWYTLDGGFTNFTFNNNIGQIDQQIWDEIWENHTDGDLITIRFYANDTLNHLGYQEVIIKIKKTSEGFEINNPTMLITTTTSAGILGIATIILRKSKKYKRMDQKQKKKANAVLYLSLLLTGLLLMTSFI
ncbi:MAG: hypothetical protein ACFE92_10360, partial [Promethearchaeota archaeon]